MDVKLCYGPQWQRVHLFLYPSVILRDSLFIPHSTYNIILLDLRLSEREGKK
jgi:hypothetical protein